MGKLLDLLKGTGVSGPGNRFWNWAAQVSEAVDNGGGGGGTQAVVFSPTAGTQSNSIQSNRLNQTPTDTGLEGILGVTNFGMGNTGAVVNASYATLSGGLNNSISSGATYGVIAGGQANAINAAADHAFIGGGRENVVGADYATIVGGYSNDMSSVNSNYGFIGGGENNEIQSDYSVVAGGQGNTAGAAAGVGPYSTVVGGQTNLAANSHAFVGGGKNNQVQALGLTGYGVIAGGQDNTVGMDYGTVGGGKSNTVGAGGSGPYATVGGGSTNGANGGYSTVSGGSLNSAVGPFSTVSGGASNQSLGQYCAVSGGGGNTATAGYSTVLGGQENQATALYSVAHGIYALASNSGDYAQGTVSTFGKGGAQYSRNVLAGSQTNIGTVNLTNAGGAQNVFLPYHACTIELAVTATRVSGTSTQAYSYTQTLLVWRGAPATLNVVGSTTAVELGDTTDAGFSYSTSGASLVLTGEVKTNTGEWRFVASVKATEVSGDPAP